MKRNKVCTAVALCALVFMGQAAFAASATITGNVTGTEGASVNRDSKGNYFTVTIDGASFNKRSPGQQIGFVTADKNMKIRVREEVAQGGTKAVAYIDGKLPSVAFVEKNPLIQITLAKGYMSDAEDDIVTETRDDLAWDIKAATGSATVSGKFPGTAGGTVSQDSKGNKLTIKLKGYTFATRKVNQQIGYVTGNKGLKVRAKELVENGSSYAIVYLDGTLPGNDHNGENFSVTIASTYLGISHDVETNEGATWKFK